MAKLIEAYEPAFLLSVEKQSQEEDRMWDWRLGYIGKPGCLSVLESERKAPERRYVHLSCRSTDTLTTGYGEIGRDGNRLTVTTEKSRYTFLVGPEVGT